MASGTCLHTFTGHTEQVISLLFSPDGKTLFSGSADRSVRVWDVETGRCQASLLGHHHWVWSLVYSAADRVLLSGSQDETIRVWNWQPETELATLRSPRIYEGMNITHATGLTEAQQATLQALGAFARS